MTTLTDQKKEGELVVRFFDRAFNFESHKVQNDNTRGSGEAADADSMLGQPVINNSGTWEFVDAAYIDGGSAIDGIITSVEKVDALAANASTPVDCRILVRGPALLNEAALPVNDVYGDAFDIANYKTKLAEIDVHTIDVSASTEVQSS